MNRTRLKQPKARPARRRTPSTRGEPSITEATPSTSPQALRILAQIAMLKRALRAAEDEGLPHKAICDYLHTLSQMAKLEPRAAPEDGEPKWNDIPPTHGTSHQSANTRERLRQVIADIYGISELPDGNPVPSPGKAPAAELNE